MSTLLSFTKGGTAQFNLKRASGRWFLSLSTFAYQCIEYSKESTSWGSENSISFPPTFWFNLRKTPLKNMTLLQTSNYKAGINQIFPFKKNFSRSILTVFAIVQIPSPIFLRFTEKKFFNRKLRWINIFISKDLFGQATGKFNLHKKICKIFPW